MTAKLKEKQDQKAFLSKENKRPKMVQPMERELVDLVKTPKKQSKTKQQRVHIFIWRRQIQTKEKKSVEESIDLEPFKVGKLALR